MDYNNALIAEAYYTAMNEKNVAEMGKYLHPDVQLITPLAELVGKEDALSAAKNLCSLFNTLTIRAKFDSKNQAMLAFDLDFPSPIGNLPIAALMTFQSKLIIKIELFYDSRLVDTKKDEIFS